MESSETIRKPRKINNTEISYIAGFFDGEGHITVQKGFNKVMPNGKTYNRTPALRIAITQVQKGILEWIQEKFGGKVYTWKRESSPLSKHPQSMWCLIRKEEMKDFLKAMKPYLKMKRQQMELGLAFLAVEGKSPGARERITEKIFEANKTQYNYAKIESNPVVTSG